MNVVANLVAFSKRPIIRCLAMIVLLTGSARIYLMSFAVLDLDLWWHLRDGDWIIAHYAFPHQGLFSQYADRPWIAYSWGFEVIVSRFYHWFGLVGFVGLRTGVEVAITGVLFWMLWRGSNDFWKAWALSALGMLTIHYCLVLQPMLFSILMFAIEISLIWEARRTRSVRPLFLLPVLFLLWANLHIQFVYGLFTLLLLTAVGTLRSLLPQKWALALEPELPLPRLLVVSGLSLVATFIGPYSWRLYGVILGYTQSLVPYNTISELQALNFRDPWHFVLVLIVMGAFFTLGWLRSRDLFKLALLVVSTVVAFRMMRDSWFVCIPALAIIADRSVQDAKRWEAPVARKLVTWTATALATVLVLTLIAWDQGVNNTFLARVVAAMFPVRACNFVRAKLPPGPIYNELNWGGFVIWSLPDDPVAIDGRTDLYGDAILSRYFQERRGPPNWESDPDVKASKLVLLGAGSPLAMLMYHDQNHRLVYSDPIAVVFVKNDAPSSPDTRVPSP
jgi:hypothetical protein